MNRERLLNQLKEDEGFVAKAYFDVKQWSIGYGCKSHEGATITEPEASLLLEQHMDTAIAGFQRVFKDHLHKFNEIREECFINLVFNMGTGRIGGSEGLLSFKNTLSYIFNNKEVPWQKVADGLQRSLWYRQVGKRAERIVQQVREGE